MAGQNESAVDQIKRLRVERDAWKRVAAKLAFMVIDRTTDSGTQAEKERTAATLLRGAADVEGLI